MNSRTVLEIARLIFDIALIWMFFGRLGKRGSARDHGDGRVEFAPDWLGLWAYPVTFVYLTWLTSRALRHEYHHLFDRLNPLLFASVALMLLFSFPGTVIAGAEGLEKVYWFRKNRRIPWQEIEEIEADKNNSLFAFVTVKGSAGTEIVHSSFSLIGNGFFWRSKSIAKMNSRQSFPIIP